MLAGVGFFFKEAFLPTLAAVLREKIDKRTKQQQQQTSTSRSLKPSFVSFPHFFLKRPQKERDKGVSVDMIM